jgi:phosphoadenosine phosphosulfate reductase
MSGGDKPYRPDGAYFQRTAIFPPQIILENPRIRGKLPILDKSHRELGQPPRTPQMTLQAAEISPAEVHDLAARFETADVEEILTWAWERFGTRAGIGTSFQGAGLVMIHKAVQAGLPLPVFTLDTQLLFPETLELKRNLENFFEIKIESIHPEQTPEEQAAEHGPELWKSAPDLCCTMRKVLPLQKKLENLAVWMTGLRRQQSDTRQRTQILELYHFDVLRDHYILKLNPMANWSREAVWEYIAANKIPYNPLHDRGYRSIGCWPCTRAVGEGVNERAGRWTGFDKSECGIHTFLGDNI